jgi:hypothetical protein
MSIIKSNSLLIILQLNKFIAIHQTAFLYPILFLPLVFRHLRFNFVEPYPKSAYPSDTWLIYIQRENNETKRCYSCL